MTLTISGGMNNFGWDTLSVNKQFIKSKKLNGAFLVLYLLDNPSFQILLLFL